MRTNYKNEHEVSGEIRANSTLVFSFPSPEFSGHKRRAAVKLSSGRKSAGHKTQRAADFLKNKQQRANRAASRRNTQAAADGRHRVLGAVPGVFTAK